VPYEAGHVSVEVFTISGDVAGICDGNGIGEVAVGNQLLEFPE
jgi:hypothetical protein